MAPLGFRPAIAFLASERAGATVGSALVSRAGAPLRGVKVHGQADAFSFGGSTWHAQSEGVETDSEGRFELDNVPAGTIKLSIDGRTATNAPNGVFFPEMVMDATLTAGRTNTLTIRVSDPDPSQFSTYTIVPPLPPGTNILNQGGIYRWIVPTNAPYGDYPVSIRATDNGLPPRSATLTLVFRVQAPTTPVTPTGPTGPVIYTLAAGAGQFTLSFQATAGRTYRVLYKNDLLDANWTPLDRDFVAGTASASISDFITGPQRYYRILQLD